MKNELVNEISVFWSKFPSHINFLEQSVKLGHNEEFKNRYDKINEEAKNIHPALQVEFTVDMMESKVDGIIITSKEKGEGRAISITIAKMCPESLKPIVTPYRLPVLPWDKDVSKSWLYDLCRQYGMPSVATEVGDCLANAKCAVKFNEGNGKLLIQFSFKNKKEHKAVGDELVLLMFDMLLGEQIIAEAIELLSINTLKELKERKGNWLIKDGLQMRDLVLSALM